MCNSFILNWLAIDVLLLFGAAFVDASVKSTVVTASQVIFVAKVVGQLKVTFKKAKNWS